VKRVAHLLDVRIEVQSEPGVGSTFALETPASEGNARHIAQTSSHGREFLNGAYGTCRTHVLIVEDDEIVRSAMARFLATEGYVVTTASSHAEALACMETATDIGVVVADYRLDRRQTGTDVLRAARTKLGPHVKAILVTGDTSSEMRELHRDRHLRIISKPIDADELLTVIQTVLDP
jgi:two-component system CheB/CheR fusion protein